MLTFIDVKFIFDSACLSESLGDKGFCKYSPNSGYRPWSCTSCCSCCVLAKSSPISSL